MENYKFFQVLPHNLAFVGFRNLRVENLSHSPSNGKIGQVRAKENPICAIEFYKKMRKSLGNKRNYISEEQIKQITEIYTSFVTPT